MNLKSQIVVYTALRKAEVLIAIWLPLEEVIERLTLATLSVAELQEVVLITLEAKYTLATSTMLTTTVLAITPVPKQWYKELEGKILTLMKQAEFINNKLSG